MITIYDLRKAWIHLALDFLLLLWLIYKVRHLGFNDWYSWLIIIVFAISVIVTFIYILWMRKKLSSTESPTIDDLLD